MHLDGDLFDLVKGNIWRLLAQADFADFVKKQMLAGT